MIGFATGALMAAVWQGAVLAALVWVGLRMLPKTPAAVRFAIWFGVFLVVTALPLWPHPAGTVQAAGRGAWLTLDMRWSLAIAAVWAAASLVRAGKLVVAAVRVRGLWKRARPIRERSNYTKGAAGRVEVIPPIHDDKTVMKGAPGVCGPGRTVETAAPSTARGDDNFAESKANCFIQDDNFVLSRRAELCVSDEVDRPTVIGFFAPKILIPVWLLEKLSPAELDQIVLHETGHLRRADDWMNLLQKIALVIFPLNPALAWVERRLCFERELAVDEFVLRAFAAKAGAATAYAACLATVAEHRLGRRGLALALGALGHESELGRRVRRILERRERMRPAYARLVLGGALMGLLSVGVALERCPQVVGFAQQQGTGIVKQGTGIREQGTVAMVDVVNFDGNLRAGVGNRLNVLRAGTDGSHEVLLKATVVGPGVGDRSEKSGSQRLKPSSPASVYGTAEAVPLTRHESAKTIVGQSPSSAGSAYRDFAGSDRMMFPPERQARVTQWVVVTSWLGEDGSRMVMTTATTENPAARASRTVSDMTPAPEQDSEQVHPYAAVPVRGGWLVFQL